MSALGVPVLINPNRSYWLSSIANDVIHSTIQVQELDADVGRFSTIFSGTANISTLNTQNFDVSGMTVSSIAANTGTFSTLRINSGDGVNPYLTFSIDPSGVQVDGAPIRFDNLVYLTSTINIVQVSTIVDVDIFASNGYFSTISTGNFSANVASLNKVNISSLYVSSLEGFDISGADPVEWSLYPTLNSSITFNGSYILSNVSNKLYFAGQELTDLSGGGQSWSQFPAFSTILANNNLINGVSTMVFQDGGTLTSATGNNLLYNGQNVSYGAQGNVANWANYAAVNTVNMANNPLVSSSLVSTNTLNVGGAGYVGGSFYCGTFNEGGTFLIPAFTIDALGQASGQAITLSPTLETGIVEVYGANRLAGQNALYAEGGTTLTGGGIIHGAEIGALTAGGIDTVRIDVLPVGMGLNSATYIQLAALGAGSFAAGGALSLAGGSYIEANTSDFNIINTTSGNQATNLTVANLLAPASVAATNPLTIQNISGGGVRIQGGGQGSLEGFSTVIGANLSTINLNVSTINGVPLSSIQTPANIVCSNINVSQSSIANAYWGNNINITGTATASQLNANQTLFVSSTAGNLRVNNIQIPDDITGITNAPNPLQSRIVNFSSIQSGSLSTIDLRVSTINGLPWDISGGGGGAVVSTYNNLFTSSMAVSSLVGIGFEPNRLVNIFGNGLQFVSSSTVFPTRMLSSLNLIYSPGDTLTVEADNIALAHLPNGYVRVGGGTSRDTFFYDSIQSTNIVLLSSIQTSGFCDISGGVRPTTDYILQDQRSFVFADVSGNDTLFSRRFVASEEMVSVINTTPEGAGNNSAPISASAFWAAPGTGGFGGARFYGVFPGDNWGVDIVDEDGALLFESINSYNTGGVNFQTNVYGVSSIVGYTAPGGSSAVGIDNLLTVPTLSSLTAQLSSINTNDARPAFTNNLQLSTMTLYNASTTLLYWDSTTTSSNINSSGYDVVAGLNGTFKIGCSLQAVNNGGNEEITFFFLKNSTAIANSASYEQTANNEFKLAYAEILEPLNNGDVIQVGAYTQGANVQLSTIGGGGVIPDSPAAIFTMYKIA